MYALINRLAGSKPGADSLDAAALARADPKDIPAHLYIYDKCKSVDTALSAPPVPDKKWAALTAVHFGRRPNRGRDSDTVLFHTLHARAAKINLFLQEEIDACDGAAARWADGSSQLY